MHRQRRKLSLTAARGTRAESGTFIPQQDNDAMIPNMLESTGRMLTSFRDLALDTGGTWWRGALERTGQTRGEIARRAALARQRAQKESTAPRCAYCSASCARSCPRGQRLRRRPARNPQPVMLLPGFGAHPGRMRRMQQALEAAGHSAEDWGLGFNLGPTQENFVFLMRRVGAMARLHGEPVALVGWSLGGLFAREIAHRQPNTVARVITLGTPFSGDRRANNAWRAYQLITGHPVDEPPVECAVAQAARANGGAVEPTRRRCRAALRLWLARRARSRGGDPLQPLGLCERSPGDRRSAAPARCRILRPKF